MSYYPRPYAEGPIEPVVEAGQNVLVFDKGAYKLYQAALIEPLGLSHPLVVNLGAIAAGANTAITSTTAALDMSDGQMAQLRAKVLDDIHAILFQPQGMARYTNMNQIARLNVFGQLADPCGHLTEFFIFEQNRPFLQAWNPTMYALAQARIAFWGFKYILDGETDKEGHMKPLKRFSSMNEAVASKIPFTSVMTGGWGE